MNDLIEYRIIIAFFGMSSVSILFLSGYLFGRIHQHKIFMTIFEKVLSRKEDNEVSIV